MTQLCFSFSTAMALGFQPGQGLYPAPAAVGPGHPPDCQPSHPSPLGGHNGSQLLHEEPPSIYIPEPPAQDITQLLPVPEQQHELWRYQQRGPGKANLAGEIRGAAERQSIWTDSASESRTTSSQRAPGASSPSNWSTWFVRWLMRGSNQLPQLSACCNHKPQSCKQGAKVSGTGVVAKKKKKFPTFSGLQSGTQVPLKAEFHPPLVFLVVGLSC